ncbi:hypothetical protein QBC35DRAFT_512646 [Podospora australis]|uniref:F-box domain-containing protein n=1 Tax=Podospora australis TaxID=1536484 RepID=A0AAN7AJP5_9PEZI|nr:hypothetical protein QBC35DRAFT_512646 [Podospora australis]
MPTVNLPYELVSYVVDGLDLVDVWHWSLTCKRFQFLFREARIAKQLLETKAPYSFEARNAHSSEHYARELRRLIKRQEAVASVSPYLVRTVAHAETWMYENGVLLYIRSRVLRILNLHASEDCEIVVNLRELLNKAIEESRGVRKYKVKLLYYADGFVSCLYTHATHDWEHSRWLLVFHPQTGRIVTVRPVEPTAKLFVRNNHRFLYYGTASEIGHDFYLYWKIFGFDLESGAWLDDDLEVPEVMGTDVGTTICFEIVDGYFYAISNQAALEVEEVEWKSFYTYFRFPLQRDGFARLERRDPEIWRRSHLEGVIDDRWYLLRMFQDEGTGQLKVVESRKEWLSRRVSPRRTYYTTVVDFQDVSARTDNSNASGGSSDSDSSRDGSSGSSPGAVDEDKAQPPGPLQACSSRNPHQVHPGDDSSTSIMFPVGQSPIRAYYASSQTFIDVVNDPRSYDPTDQRIRIRGSSRRLWNPDERERRQRLPSVYEPGTQDWFDDQVNALYRHEEVITWPTDQGSSGSDAGFAALDEVLNPKGFIGNLHGCWDERSMVFATGSSAPGGLNALVFVSWDPSIYLTGTMAYTGNRGLGASCPRTNDSPSPKLHTRALSSSYQGGGKNKDIAKRYPDNLPESTPRLDRGIDLKSCHKVANGVSWVTLESALYRELPSGFHFAR